MDGDDIYSIPSSPAAGDSEDDQDYRAPRKSANRRRSTRGGNRDVPDGLDQEETAQGEDTETPAKAGTRSSGRQRKAPQRLEGEVVTPSSTRRGAATPRSTRGTRSAQKPKQESVDNEEMDLDEASPKPTASVARTRSRRSVARPRANGAKNEGQNKELSPSPEGYNDGLDDLVALQLQQEIQIQEETRDVAEVVEPVPEYIENLQKLCREGLHDEMRVLTTAILEKLSGKQQIPLKGVENEYTKVNHLIEQTVTVGEGNSMLLLGSRGCGKSAMVETIISSLARDHGNDFHVVRLNGFLHTDDRLALREMWRQLGRETHTEDDTAKVSSYADTMATLLALLSHPEELFGASGNANGVTAAKSIVILLDEFDLFVTHPRQTLLYNLFDIAQARKAPIAVIGLTTKVDVTEMLEKRVKSRFSHRYVYIPLPRTYEIFSDICMASLDLNESEVVQLARSLGERHSIVESNAWKTLLEGWKIYLKVCDCLFQPADSSI
jgi:origin recognition complex subunit 4